MGKGTKFISIAIPHLQLFAGLVLLPSNVKAVYNAITLGHYLALPLVVLGVSMSLFMIFCYVTGYPHKEDSRKWKLEALYIPFIWFVLIKRYYLYYKLGRRDHPYSQSVYYHGKDLLSWYVPTAQRFFVGVVVDDHDRCVGGIAETIDRYRAIMKSDPDTRKEYTTRKIGDRLEMLEVFDVRYMGGRQYSALICKCCGKTCVMESAVFSTKMFTDHRDFVRSPNIQGK